MGRAVVIAGGGMAGMSLACARAQHGFRGDVTLVDARTEPDIARTWCWWDVPGIAFRAVASYRWPAWRIAGGGCEVVRRSQRHAYLHLSGREFFTEAERRLRGSGMRYVRGDGVVAIDETVRGAVIRCASGRTVAADVAIDARGIAPPPAGSLVQRFVGRIVRTRDPVFAPDVATLMDFQPARDSLAHFTYVLPFARDRALVENTRFTRGPADDATQRADLERYVRDVLRTTVVAVEGVECGALPLHAAAPPLPTKHVAYAGAAGGAVRASSGYAFVRTQRHVAALAAAIATDAPFPVPGNTRYRALDAVLLALLSGGALHAPRFFTTLFAGADPGALARFLSDASTPIDDARVLAGWLRHTA